MSIRSSIRVLLMAVLVAIVCGLPGRAAVAQTPTPTGSISGTVTDLSLVPIQGATVRACPEGEGECSSTTSGPDGEYIISNLAPGPYSVDASAAGRIHIWYDGQTVPFFLTSVEVVAGETSSGIDFQLDAAGTISGKVTDANGDGIAAAEVCATVHILPWGYLAQCAETGPDGSYSVDVFYTEEYEVCASADGYAFTCYGGAHQPNDAALVSVVLGEDTPNIDISLDEEGTISGIVTRASDGQPIEGAFIIAIPEGDGYFGFGHSGADGVYTITGLAAGGYVLRSETEGYVQVFYDDAFDRDSATVVLVTEGENTPDIDFALLVSGAVSGRVTDSNGTPLEGVYVDACLAPDYEICDGVGTDSDGRYEIDGLLPGDYVVGAWHEDYISEYYNDKRSEGEADLVNVVEGQTRENIDFMLGVLGAISGKVTDTGGTPIEGVQVEACPDDPDYDYCESDNTEADGSYQITGLAGGNYVVRTDSDGYADEYYDNKPSWDDADRVSVVEGEETPNIDFALGPSGTISGTVMDTGGSPIAGADVVACPQEEGNCESDESAPDGSYTITGLEYLGYEVRASATGYVREYWQDVRRSADATPVPVSEGNLNQTGIDFHLDVGGTISGTVTGGGNPVQGADVIAYDVSDPWNTFSIETTDASGHYVIASVGAGSYLVSASKEGYAWEYYHEVRWEEDATPVSVTDSQDTPDIDFTLDAGGTICGTVRDKDGNPIAGAVVYANPQNHEEPWWWWIFQGFMGSRFMDTSELDGTYAIPDLGTGSYVVGASAEGYADKYYNAVADLDDASPVPVTEGYSSCSIDFVFGSDEPVDNDGDGVPDQTDNCPFVANPPAANGLDDDADGTVDEAGEQANLDHAARDNGPDVVNTDVTIPGADYIGDACDEDIDNDWMLNTGTSPLGVPGEDVGCGSGATNSLLADTDGDTVLDGAECLLNTDPNNPASKPSGIPPGDSDRDGLPAALDVVFCDVDYDLDTLIGDADQDCDNDGLSDGLEVRGWDTLPGTTDSDGDGCDDDKEVADINGDRIVSVLDPYLVARMVFWIVPTHPIADLNKDGAFTVLDALLAARNSVLLESQSVCPAG